MKFFGSEILMHDGISYWVNPICFYHFFYKISVIILKCHPFKSKLKLRSEILLVSEHFFKFNYHLQVQFNLDYNHKWFESLGLLDHEFFNHALWLIQNIGINCVRGQICALRQQFHHLLAYFLSCLLTIIIMNC